MSPTKTAVTLDIDWASEAAIEETLRFFKESSIPLTIFSTHDSAAVRRAMRWCEVGVHPYFAADSSHGSTTDDVVRFVRGLPRNVSAYRCHRYLVSNELRRAMSAAGFSISSNICSDLEPLPPFRERGGSLEYPVFLEDGGYLLRQHSLDGASAVRRQVSGIALATIAIHPMHFALNSPSFQYMRDIKNRLSRSDWNRLSSEDLERLRWNGLGIRDFLVELLMQPMEFTTLGADSQARSITT